MPTNWEIMCGKLLGASEIPEEWIRTSSDAEESLRRALQFKLLDMLKDPLIEDMASNFQRSFYVYFWAYSIGITQQFINDAEFPYQQQFCSLSRQDYLDLWADFYCHNLVATHRDDPQLVRNVVCTLDLKVLDRYDPRKRNWFDFCHLAGDESKFCSEMSVELYKRLADKIGLPQDARTLEELRDRDEYFSNSLALGISQLFNELSEIPEFMQCVEELLSY